MKHKHFSVLSLVLFCAAAASAQITLNSVASRAVGSPALLATSNNPNLVEGREFYTPQDVALDSSVSPPALYVSDFGNNRVLAWKSVAAFSNGQKADLAIGQPDLQTTFPGGPGTQYTTGLFHPTGIAIDKSGNLYVADSGNNRVLRYPKPFQQTSQYPFPDLYIGQATLNGRNPNYTGQVGPQGIFLSLGNTVLQANIAFDSTGNLWMTDPGNVRVLRFKQADLAAGGGALTADLELGQLDLKSVQTPLSTGDPTSVYRVNQFFFPDTLGFDSSGNLFVTDSVTTVSGRVLVFIPPFSIGMGASSRMIGVFPSGYKLPTDPAAAQTVLDNSLLFNPEGIFFPTGSTTGVGIVDSAAHRIMLFPPFANWPADGTPPAATSIIGQPNTCPQYANQLCKAANNGNLQGPANNTFASPTGAAYSGTDLFVGDTGNNRVLDLPQQGGTFPSATRVLGQDYFNTNSINLIEGREFDFTGVLTSIGAVADSAIAIDTASTPPHVYVSDPYNHRVLGFKNLFALKPGIKADLVLGQADFTTSLVNYPSGDATKPTKSSLYRPTGLLLDANGNLYVADSLNARVLRFPAPFAYTGPAPEPADLVLGQANFTTKITDPTSSTMAVPYGLSFTPACPPAPTSPCAPNGLLVSDQADNRVLYIPMTNGNFTAGTDNGKAATTVFGQLDFKSVTTGNTQATMNGPHHVACDTNGFVYVADSGNNRILIFNDPHSAGTPSFGASAPIAINGLSGPQGVYVSPITGEIWVANTGAGTAVRYANYNSVLLGNGSISTIQEASGTFSFRPLALAQDQYGDLFVADDASRVAVYFPGLSVCNGASLFPTFAARAPNLCAPYDNSNGAILNAHPLAPGVFASIFPCANCSPSQFGTAINQFTGNYPVPPVLGDVQVLFDGVPAPLYLVTGPVTPNSSSGQINFIVPNGARTAGNASLEVSRVSTGQVLGTALVPMATVAPAILMCASQTAAVNRIACVENLDYSVNGPNNPVTRGSYISIYATGEGYVANAPPDGVPATSLVYVPNPTVLINGVDVNDTSRNGGETQQHIQYSGLDGLPGVWQINVQIPMNVAPSSQTGGVTLLNIVVNGVANIDLGLGWKTVIFVK